jgi:hypothetical protein
MKWVFLIVLFFLVSGTSWALVDPLGSQFFPAIDENPGDYGTALGTVTITDSLYKVWQSSVSPSNTRWAVIYLMQNEWQSFQVHVSPSVNIASLTITMSNLVDTQTVPSTIIYATSTNIEIYREFYLNIGTPTALSTTTYMGGARAWMPDILIPSVDPYWGQTTNAFPVSVTAGNTQSAWIDVHIPTTSPSGYYYGSVYVASGTVVVSTMPVVFAVWSWIMSSTASLGMVSATNGSFGYNYFCDVAYGGTTNCGQYPHSGGSADTANSYQWIDGSRELLDHRWTVSYPSNFYPGSGSFSNYVTNIGPLINGVPQYTSTTLQGAALTKVQLEPLTFTSSEWQNWSSSFTNQGWFPRLFNYLCDEPPNGCSWAQIVSSGSATRTFSSPVVPNLVTADLADAITNGATNYIDWMTPIIENLDTVASGNLRSTYNTWLSTSSFFVSRQIGSYADCESAGTCSNGTIGPANTPPYPNRHIDGTPVANRAFETWAFLNNISYELYFALDYCSGPGNCPTSSPWTSDYAFGCNGDGTIIYPSTSTYVSFTVSPSTPIWIPSMRLKYFRDGEQDYEYENYLTQQGYGTFVQSEIASWMTNGYTFNVSPSGLESARFAMGQKIHQLTYPSNAINPSEQWSGSIRATGILNAN